MPRRSSRLSLVVLLACLAGCDRTSQLVVGILTNLKVRGELSEVRLDASRNGVVIDTQSWSIADTTGLDFTLPGSFSYYSERGGTPVVELDLQGYLDDTLVVERTSQIQLSSDKQLFYRMSLVLSCKVGSPSATDQCPDGLSCVEGICKPIAVDASTLPTYAPSLVSTIECDSGSSFIDTGTCHTGTCAVLPIATSGCGTNQFCQEGTCYKRDSAQPRQLQFGEACDASAGDTCVDAGVVCATSPGETTARCRQGCAADSDCTRELPDAQAQMIPATRAVCAAGPDGTKACTYACDPVNAAESGCLSGERCVVVTNGEAVITPDCVTQPSTAASVPIGSTCVPQSEENEPCVTGSQCAILNGGAPTCYKDCIIGDSTTCAGTCTGIVSAGGVTSTTWGICAPTAS